MVPTKRARWLILSLLVVLGALLAAATLSAQTLREDSLKGMKWRLIGPFRGGRVLAVAGVPSDPNVYYFGAVAGGVWKNANGGLNLTPGFLKEALASIGGNRRAPSAPQRLYAGARG